MSETNESYKTNFAETKDIVFKIFRYDPDVNTEPHFDTFTVPVVKGWTVLDAVMHIKENMDSTVSYRASCRMGICGSCAMDINGKPRLACQTQVIAELQSDEVVIKPLANYPILRDIVPDLTPLIQNHEAVKPYIIRKDKEDQKNPKGELYQTPDELEEYLQFSYCIKCGACMAACPVVATDEEFPGPQALTQAYRYTIDTRDDGFMERIDSVDKTHGAWRCHFAGACSDACPKGVDPAFAIQLLKREITARKFGKKREPAPIAKQPVNVKRLESVPYPPEKTVK
ncbi:MAG: succinate dehydrogenase iron-sulfur subunit [Calditrichaeota bacterium]|nr:succinate dehydrogenase iron-sulfur subunit [Calditrichota bacterium]